jgi:glycine/D-amino acid oxidase-like deaminating enzyme
MKTTTVFERQPPSDAVIAHSLERSTRTPFWTADAPLPRISAKLRGSITADLVIVGAGYTGLWTALLAKERHPEWNVVVVEGKTAGWAASGRNGGWVDSSLTHGESNGRSRFPDEYELLDKAGVDNLDEIERTVTDRGWDCDFWREGSLSVATEPHQVEWLRESADGQREIFLDRDEVAKRVKSPTYLAANFTPRDTALVHPGKLTRELVATITDLGVLLFENSPVKKLEASDSDVTVSTAGGTVRSPRVALATNAFPSLLKRYRLHTVPVYDYVLMTEPLDASQREAIGWSGREGIGDMANQFHYYRMTADHRILFGGYDAIYYYGGQVRSRYEERPESYRKLASHFFTTFPQLEGLRFSHRWAGAIDTCSRFSAFFATAHSGKVAYSAGFTGLGVAATRFAANVMLDQLTGLDTWRTRLEMVRTLPTPFPPEPFAYPAVQATRFALDRADHRAGQRGLFLKTLDSLGLGFDS